MFILATSAHASPALEQVYAFDTTNPPGNVAVCPDGDIYMSLHGFHGRNYRVVKIQKNGVTTPYPSNKWSSPPTEKEPDIGFNNVLGLQCDNSGVLWVLDGTGPEQSVGKLVAWDTNNEVLKQVVYLGQPHVGKQAFLNDLAIDTTHRAAYITDTAAGEDSALIVIDLETGRARRVLEGHSSMKPEAIDMIIDGKTVMMGESTARIGVNPITIDHNNEWVYYGPMTGKTLYKIKTKDLIDFSLNDSQLAARVKVHGKKPLCDGITVDNGGNVYITSITDNSIGVVKPDGSYETLIKDASKLSWPDGLSVGPDGMIYVTVNQLHRSKFLNGGKSRVTGAYFLQRFKPLDSVSVGR